jgi:hypothetical protein
VDPGTIGERLPLPAIRANAPDTLIIAYGFARRRKSGNSVQIAVRCILRKMLNFNHGAVNDAGAYPR